MKKKQPIIRFSQRLCDLWSQIAAFYLGRHWNDKALDRGVGV